MSVTSPAPYSKPKRLLFSKYGVKFATKAGSYVYAPHGGTVHTDGGSLVVCTASKYEHKIRNVKLSERLKAGDVVRSGQRIGTAVGRKIVYTRRGPSGKEIDAMEVALRDDSRVAPREFFKPAKRRVPADPGGVMGPGTERKVVWHTSESDWRDGIDGVVEWIQKMGSQYTLLWNPYEKDRRKRFVQIYSSRVGARALKNDFNFPTNRHGELCIQICVIGRKSDSPLSKSPMYGRRELMEWLDYHKIPRKLVFDQKNPKRSRVQWMQSGHATHSVCPGNDHTDPGYINTKKLFAP